MREYQKIYNNQNDIKKALCLINMIPLWHRPIVNVGRQSYSAVQECFPSWFDGFKSEFQSFDNFSFIHKVPCYTIEELKIWNWEDSRRIYIEHRDSMDRIVARYSTYLQEKYGDDRLRLQQQYLLDLKEYFDRLHIKIRVFESQEYIKRALELIREDSPTEQIYLGITFRGLGYPPYNQVSLETVTMGGENLVRVFGKPINTFFDNSQEVVCIGIDGVLGEQTVIELQDITCLAVYVDVSAYQELSNLEDLMVRRCQRILREN